MQSLLVYTLEEALPSYLVQEQLLLERLALQRNRK
jgi:hypothetical protein